MGKPDINEETLKRSADKVRQWSESLLLELAEVFGTEVEIVRAIDMYAITMADVLSHFSECTGTRIDLNELFVERFRQAAQVYDKTVSSESMEN